MRRLWIVVDLVLLVLCLAAVVPVWRNGTSTVALAAADELPGFTATRYSGPWLGSATVLVAVAGLAVIDLVARCARSR